MSDWTEFFLTVFGTVAYAAFATAVVAMALKEARRNGRAPIEVSRSNNQGGDHGC
jgi:hypothetical protein